MKKLVIVFLGFFLLQGCLVIDSGFDDPVPSNDYKVLPIYVVPADKDYINDNAVRVWRATYAMQNWYQTATGGVTFELLDEENVFQVYGSDYPIDYYSEDWWTLLLEELRAKGFPVQVKGTILMVFVEGITDLGGDELALGGWSCDGDCGAAILPISTLMAPTRLPVDMGTVFHEFGHALGLGHPVEQADLPLSVEEEVILYSVMCQSDIRAGTTNTEHGLLTSEKAALIKSPFMKENVATYQDIWSSTIINYPVLGEVPDPEISYEVLPNAVVQFTSNIDDGLLYYWYFGDGTVSTERNPQHTFNNFGLYNVTLMVTSRQYMAARTSSYINLN